jgi:hypothetical protein
MDGAAEPEPIRGPDARQELQSVLHRERTPGGTGRTPGSSVVPMLVIGSRVNGKDNRGSANIESIAKNGRQYELGSRTTPAESGPITANSSPGSQ